LYEVLTDIHGRIEKMAKYDVHEIKEEADRTLEHYRGRKGNQVAQIRHKPLSIRQMRVYIKKVLFLCKHIEKLEAKKK
jgi:hypothetical protein